MTLSWAIPPNKRFPTGALLFFTMGMLGMGNGAVFQLLPQRFPERIGILTGLVGAAGGFGGFLLPSLLGAIKDRTGQYSWGLYLCAAAFFLAAATLLELGTQWHLKWHESSWIVQEFSLIAGFSGRRLRKSPNELHRRVPARRANVLQRISNATLRKASTSRMVKKLEWIEMAQLAVSSILFKSLCRVAGGHCWPPAL